MNIEELYPKKIAFAGDWHMNGPYGAHAINYAQAEGAEVLVHTGDFGWRFSETYLNLLTTVLEIHDLHLYFVDGNHEDFPRLYSFPMAEDGTRTVTDRIHHLPRGFRWSWNGTLFLALGGAHSVDRPLRVPGASWWPEERITDRDMARAISGGPVDVMVTHDAPTRARIPGLEDTLHFWSDEELRSSDENRDRLQQVVYEVRPHLLVHGHYHRRYHFSLALPGTVQCVDIHGLNCDGFPLEENLCCLTDFPNPLPRPKGPPTPPAGSSESNRAANTRAGTPPASPS